MAGYNWSHPYFAVTAADGSFEIKDVPAGKYVVEVWHGLGTKTRSQVGDTPPRPTSAK
jgi:hypothetical protein